ncbi:XRE family transcriptional regulator XdrA [Salinicoccus halodurans]|uniref:Cro/Cl family transcriptional regulator n=1 Tax=Salinicoccus halodurans TaxID=407035 RepID=A0A0F7HN17_9STAP|nr:transcriptional regulator [Salinicoccus halodurans]AKG74438.1 Cro/Cl family transcriptional regulator [Salinicoccus halodurans]SFK96013.1 DNA-binding transcriptional regulator, XRE-family HTH domain [Salinicoccus halodurans]
MDKQAFTEILQSKFKMVRTEAGYTQDSMSHTIGLSKKTLVQIEKERILPNWTTCISLCALFRESEVLTNTFGGDPLELAQVISRGHCVYPNYESEAVYWEELETKNGFRLEYNKSNNIYRVLNPENRPVHASYIEREIRTFFLRQTDLQPV